MRFASSLLLVACVGSAEPPVSYDHCNTVGDVIACDDLCGDPECESAGGRCDRDVELCLVPDETRIEFDTFPASDTCAVWRDHADYYCFHGDYFCPDFDYDAPCVPAEYCQTHDCVYSDGTAYIDGPPVVDVCPPRPPDIAPDYRALGFCGGPCGGCPLIDGTEFALGRQPVTNCMGQNEERGLGVCTLVGPGCDGTVPYGGYVSIRSDELACLVIDRASGGSVTTRNSCLAYRDLYPEDVECRGREWELLP